MDVEIQGISETLHERDGAALDPGQSAPTSAPAERGEEGAHEGAQDGAGEGCVVGEPVAQVGAQLAADEARCRSRAHRCVREERLELGANHAVQDALLGPTRRVSSVSIRWHADSGMREAYRSVPGLRAPENRRAARSWRVAGVDPEGGRTARSHPRGDREVTIRSEPLHMRIARESGAGAGSPHRGGV